MTLYRLWEFVKRGQVASCLTTAWPWLIELDGKRKILHWKVTVLVYCGRLLSDPRGRGVYSALIEVSSPQWLWKHLTFPWTFCEELIIKTEYDLVVTVKKKDIALNPGMKYLSNNCSGPKTIWILLTIRPQSKILADKAIPFVILNLLSLLRACCDWRGCVDVKNRGELSAKIQLLHIWPHWVHVLTTVGSII